MEIINELSTLRDELFDAPSDVKASFNQVCQYFDSYDSYGSYDDPMGKNNKRDYGKYTGTNDHPFSNWKPGDLIELDTKYGVTKCIIDDYGDGNHAVIYKGPNRGMIVYPEPNDGGRYLNKKVGRDMKSDLLSSNASKSYDDSYDSSY